MLRSAGFPADLLDGFASSPCVAAADAHDEAGRRAAACIAEALAALGARLDTLRAATGDPADAADRKRLQKALRALRDSADTVAATPFLDPLLHRRLVDALSARTRTQARLREAHAAAREVFSEFAAVQAANPLLREAVSWQNHAALSTALDPIARRAPMSAPRRHQREALLANYLQRYALKNDTIGFFGPMTWATIAPHRSNARYAHGPGLVTGRSVRFEDWPIALLAADMARDDRVMPWLSPRLMPFLRVEGSQLCLPGGHRMALQETDAAVLALCDGRHTVAAIEAALQADPFGPPVDTADLVARLRRLEQAERVYLGFDIPSGDPQPERALRAHLRRITDAAVRDALDRRLEHLVGALSGVAAAAGDAAAVPVALEALDAAFVAETGSTPRRREGEAYGGRALAYEDCRRDLQLSFSESTFAPIRAALDFVLSSCRWFTAEVAGRFHERFAAQVEQLQAKPGQDASRPVRFVDFWLQAQAVLFGEEDLASDLAATLRERWEAVVRPFDGPDPRRCQRDSRDLAAAMAAAFPSSKPGWAMARHQSPDLMFCAPSPEALLAGDYLAVLGEVHMGGNTVATNLFLSQHPDPHRFLEALRHDLGAPYACPKLSPESSGTPIRTQFVDDPLGAREVLFSRAVVPANPATALNAAELLVALDEGQLVVHDGGPGFRMPLMDVLGDFVFLRVMNHFGITGRRRHAPRITIDQLVVQRERWMFAAAELAPLVASDDGENFCAARRWAREHGLPEQLFVKVAWEDKPFFVDLRNPVLVGVLCHRLRAGLAITAMDTKDPMPSATPNVSFTEMLPGTHELWLTDAQGARYTSELRLVAIHRDDLPVAHA